MDNILFNAMKQDTNYTLTENGGITHKTTMSAILDLFAMGAALRNRDEQDVIDMFIKAYNENADLAMKMLFYIRDVRGNGGQGERRFFRVIIKYMANHFAYRESIRKNLQYIPFYGRWDDLYALVDTALEPEMFAFMRQQFMVDMMSDTPSLLAKWMKSENATSAQTRALCNLTRQAMELNHSEYRKALAMLRSKIRIVETLMSQGKWDEIQFDKIPSKAGLLYRYAFAKHDYDRYLAFVKSKESKVHAGTLYPYEVVHQALSKWNISDIDRLAVNKYWDNLTDYFNGATLNALCMIDTSGSMYGTPLEVAISLGLYCAERNQGPWKNHFITFSSRPNLCEIRGSDFVDKVWDIEKHCIVDNTNIQAAFELVLNTCKQHHLSQEALPQNLIVISDMEFDAATVDLRSDRAETVLEAMARKFHEAGYQMPKLIFWNVDSRQNNIPMIGDGYVSYVSGFSPTIFTSILTGKTGYDLMLEAIDQERYAQIRA